MSIDFKNSKRGEINELRMELLSVKITRKKEALKKIIASMTLGKDVSPLFTDVLKCMDTPNIEIKKLVYLYIINYAKSQPDLAILAVNTFRKDARERANPLMRGLAVRTMGCIGVESIIDYIWEPLKDALNDEDPYVRKTAAISVSKLYDISPDRCEELEFVERLIDLLSDGNAMVVSNAVASLTEITNRKGKFFEMDGGSLHKLLTALSECTEWGRVYILDFLATHLPEDTREIEGAVQRVVPHLSHSNAAVVLSAAKVLIKYMDYIDDVDKLRSICRKLAPPLVSLMSSNPEIQYIAIKNINLILQKRNDIFRKGEEMKVFFWNFNDPLYVKLEKLEIMIRLVDLKSIDQFLHEVKEYAQELDVPFVRKSISAIGRCAIKLEKAADRWVQALIELVRTKVDYLVQESVKVIKDIFRRYPNRYESIIKDFWDNLKALNFADERAAMIWIIGEYADKISNSVLLIESFAENFNEEANVVQHAILTAAVKIYLKLEDEAEAMIAEILKLATEETDNSDLRNRGYVYWRMLTSDPEMAKEIILEEKPLISDHSEHMEPALLDSLISYLGTLYSISMKPPGKSIIAREKVKERFDLEDDEEIEEVEVVEDSTGMKRTEYKGEAEVQTFDDLIGLGGEEDITQVEELKDDNGLGSDLLDEMLGISPPTKPEKAEDFGDNFELDILGWIKEGDNALQYWRIPEKLWLEESDTSKEGKSGLEVSASFQRMKGKLVLEMNLTNSSSSETITDFAIKFDKNSFGLNPAEDMPDISLRKGESSKAIVHINTNENNNHQDPEKPIKIYCAMRTNLGVFLFHIPIMLSVLFVQQSTMASVNESDSGFSDHFEIPNMSVNLSKPLLIKERLIDNAILFLHEGRTNSGHPCLYFSAKTTANQFITLQLAFKDGECILGTKTKTEALVPLVQQWVSFILSRD
jgi:vesicle coat complex subunit